MKRTHKNWWYAEQIKWAKEFLLISKGNVKFPNLWLYEQELIDFGCTTDEEKDMYEECKKEIKKHWTLIPRCSTLDDVVPFNDILKEYFPEYLPSNKDSNE